jgi:hypothetical protein
MNRLDNQRVVRARRDIAPTARSWLGEAPLRRLISSSDPDAAVLSATSARHPDMRAGGAG